MASELAASFERFLDIGLDRVTKLVLAAFSNAPDIAQPSNKVIIAWINSLLR